jgi:eukaryotic-like serine/threonine-protein kinase
MGEVWLARNEFTEREFAVKFLLSKYAEDAEMLSRFVREAKVSGRVRHPGVVEIFDAGRAPELGGVAFLVMEVLEGTSLHDLLVAEKTLPLRFVLDLATEVACALGALHKKGIVHRDVKPSNIFLHRGADGRVTPKIVDFGIAKLMAATPSSASASDAGELTRSGAVVGSPRYLSPEQAAGRRDVDARADVHGLGLVMWTCVTGHSPFDTSNYNTMIVSVIADGRRPLREVVADVPDEVSQVVAKAIARERDERYEDGDALAAALEAVRRAVTTGPSLDTHDWIAHVMAHAAASSSSRVLDESCDPSRSIGAVSVSFATTRTAEAVEVLPLSSPAPQPPTPAPISSVSVPAPRPVAPLLVGAGAAVACVGAIVAMVVHLRGAPSSPPASSFAAERHETPAPPAPTAFSSALSSETTPLASSAPAISGSRAVDAGSRSAESPRRIAPHAAPRASAPSAEAADPHRGITTSGL